MCMRGLTDKGKVLNKCNGHITSQETCTKISFHFQKQSVSLSGYQMQHQRQSVHHVFLKTHHHLGTSGPVPVVPV